LKKGDIEQMAEIFKSEKTKVKCEKFIIKNIFYTLQGILNFLLFILFLILTFHPSFTNAEIKDCVVASVDDTAITLSELEEKYTQTIAVTPDITKEEVLNTMINRILLLEEAKKIRLQAPSEDEMLKEYIDLKIRAFINIPEKELSDFYEKHLEDFQGKEFDTVRNEIENYLIEKEVNERLKSLINELRKNVCIKIQLNQ
jgi:hypothetical protein